MPIYMQFEGLKGSVTTTGHEGWIDLASCQFGVNRRITNPTGRGTNREASVPSISEIVVTKDTDIASTGLFRASLWGDGKKVRIDFCKTEKDEFALYLQVDLENCLINNYSVSGHGGLGHAQPMESLTLNFTKMTTNSVPMKPEATAGWTFGDQ